MFASFFDAKHLPHVGFGKACFFLSQNYKERIPIGKSWPLDSLDSHGRVRLKSASSWPEMLSRRGSIVSKAQPGKHQHAAKLECHPQAAHPKERTCNAGSNNGVWSVQHCRELVYSTAECFRRPATCWPASSWDTTSSFPPCLLASTFGCLGKWPIWGIRFTCIIFQKNWLARIKPSRGTQKAKMKIISLLETQPPFSLLVHLRVFEAKTQTPPIYPLLECMPTNICSVITRTKIAYISVDTEEISSWDGLLGSQQRTWCQTVWEANLIDLHRRTGR